MKLGIAAKYREGELHPTLADLLALGEYPQEFYPRLNVSFACYPGVGKSDVSADGIRMLDSRTLIGPIPCMVEDTLAAVRQNTRTGTAIEGVYRKEVPEYPSVAVREAVVNALMHRDDSSDALGTPVQVDLFAERLEITSPGGLFGNVTVRTLGTSSISSTRNQHLANLLESTPYTDGGFVAENRGTGYQVIEASLRNAHMPAPVPRDTIASFSLTMPQSILEEGTQVASALDQIREAVVSLLQQQDSVSTAELMRCTGRSRSTVNKYVNDMVEEGILVPLKPQGSTRQRYERRDRHPAE